MLHLLFIKLDAAQRLQGTFQDSATPIHEGLLNLYEDLICLLVGILFFVLVFLVFILYWYVEEGRAVNKIRFMPCNSHTLLEFIWTLIPGLLLVVLVMPTFSLLYAFDDALSTEFTLKVIGHQWYWSYAMDRFNPFPFRTPEVSAWYLTEIYKRNLDFCDKYVEDFLNIERNNIYKQELDALWGIELDKLQKTLVSLDSSVVVDANFIENQLNLLVDQFVNQNLDLFDKYDAQLKADSPKNLYKSEMKALLRSEVSKLQKISFSFDSYMVGEANLLKGQLRLLEVDNRLLLPKKTSIRALITSTDVLHSWAIPSFGVKMDACPGRLNQVSLFINRSAVYYGQCSEICGINHAFIPICIEVH